MTSHLPLRLQDRTLIAAKNDSSPKLQHNLDKRSMPFHFENKSEALPPLEYSHIPAMIREAANSYSSLKALSVVLPTGVHHSLTFTQVNAFSDAFAAYLREELRLATGSRIAVQMPNSFGYVIAALGILKAGCTLVNINPLYTPTETQAQIADAEVSVLVVVDLFADRVSTETIRIVDTIVVASVVDFFPIIKRQLLEVGIKYLKRKIPSVSYQHHKLRHAVIKGEARLSGTPIDMRDYLGQVDLGTLAALQYTGGTAGTPKGVMLTHGNVLANVQQSLIRASDKIKLGQEVSLTVLPLYHIFAFSINLLGMIQAGGHSVLIPSPRPIDNLRPAFEHYPITWMSGVTRLFDALLDSEWFQRQPPRHLKATVAGGMALDPETAERWEQVTNSPIAEGYGLTEASPSVAATPFAATNRRNTVGPPLPGTRIELRNPGGDQVEVGQPGEIYVAGPQVMRGYWRRPSETTNVLKDGWLATGDIATTDERGFLRIIDRKKDVINVGGFNVYPAEVERCLIMMPQILEAVVLGTGTDVDQKVTAIIVSTDDGLTEKAVLTHCRAHLTNYKIPRKIEFRSALPKSPVGKILKKNLKDESDVID